MNNIGIIVMAAKPFHIGHQMLIDIAAKECDNVFVFVSITDRIRSGEFAIRGATMKKAWDTLITKTLPKNVHLMFCNSSPMTSAWRFLENENKNDSDNIYHIYGDSTDLNSNFSLDKLLRYTDKLQNNNQLLHHPIQRTLTNNVSGTLIRKFISIGDFESFASNVPDTIDKKSYWELLLLNKLSV